MDVKIYFVEDEQDLSEIIRKYLEKEGFCKSIFKRRRCDETCWR